MALLDRHRTDASSLGVRDGFALVNELPSFPHTVPVKSFFSWLSVEQRHVLCVERMLEKAIGFSGFESSIVGTIHLSSYKSS